MTNKANFGDVVTAMVTPFKPDADQNVAYDEVESLTRYLINNGTDTILLTGSTGEAAQLSVLEKWDILRTVRKAVPQARIMVATSDTNTGRAIQKAKTAFQYGADSILVAVPEYVKPSQKALFIHFNAIAKAIDNKPMMIYNIPGRTSKEIAPSTVADLAKENPNIVGIKQSMPSMDRVSELRALCPPDFQIYSGDDSLTLPMLALGATGVVSVMSHLEGKMIKEMIQNFKGGYLSQAQRRHYLLHPLFARVTMHADGDDFANPLPIKEALYQRGLISSPKARTLGEMSENAKADMKKCLAEFDKAKAEFYAQPIFERKGAKSR
ncbi:MAG: 4-hydroxy-tetrahydrodipicolinate synthase [Alphaproteobacteria bacterium]|nr:4-hydroxy-tetrahydrodipicolinate synthase [Alphaproteobacteria bacterium]